MSEDKISVREIVGGGYDEYWQWRGRYRVVKGSRASKKSKTTALWYIVNMMKYQSANTLVVRKTYRTLKDSCFRELNWAIGRLKVQKYWRLIQSPLTLEYIPTGQKIFFRGLDDPLKITSMTVDVGVLCWLWIEESYEITKEDDFNILDESIRGRVSDGLFKQITLTFNPWNEHHWLKKRFFDVASPDVLAITTNYMCNEFLDSADIKVFESMKANNPRRYQVAGLGEWGSVDGLVFENFVVSEFNKELIVGSGVSSVFGLDFGYTNDPTAFFCGLVDEHNKIIYVFDEMYEKGMSNEKIYKKIASMGYCKEKIVADSAEPKSIDSLRELGLNKICSARKGVDSIKNGIDKIQGFEIIIHPRCVNFAIEISNYTWACDRLGNKINRPIDEFNHLMDAMRYAVEGVGLGDRFSFE